ncbi:OTU domain-containing protein 6 [Microdochium nivale]|nr:OTU domain-containing protein 6 [Microdochium nivale]
MSDGETQLPSPAETAAAAAVAETLEEAYARHRKEQRDLQSRVTQKKKNATKKTRKGVSDECAGLERDLAERQALEIAALKGEVAAGVGGSGDNDERDGDGDVDRLAGKLGDTNISSTPSAQAPSQPQPSQDSDGGGGGAGKKRNRQKERLARRAAEVEAASAAAESEATGMTDHRAVERAYMTTQFKAQGLVEEDIRPDGHCLFSAVVDQLQARGYATEDSAPGSVGAGSSPSRTEEEDSGESGPEPGYKVARRLAADYMVSHRDDFEPFLAVDDEIGSGSGGFDGYIEKMRNTAAWGGQLELTALANVYGVEIRVVQDGRTETIAPSSSSSGGAGDKDEKEKNKRTIWLAYYRHGYGLGEHYNSLRPAL